MSYRELYKKYYNISFGSDYAIHHINHDHYDNRIENLLLIPKKLHSKYHFAIERLSAIDKNKNGIIDVRLVKKNTQFPYGLRELYDALTEANKWIQAKECSYDNYGLEFLHIAFLNNGGKNEIL